MRAGPRTNTAHISPTGEFNSGHGPKRKTMQGVYRRAAKIALDQGNYALYQLFCVPIAIDTILRNVLKDALCRFDDVAASKLLDVYIARISDNAYAGQTSPEDDRGVLSIHVHRQSRLNPFKHQHDNVADGLLELYKDFPLLKPVGGLQLIGQDKSEPCIFEVGCLEQTKKKVFETLAFYWANTENQDLSRRILLFFLTLPFKEGDQLNNGNGKSHDRELALSALKSETENIHEHILVQQIRSISQSPDLPSTSSLGTSDMAYREKLLKLLIMGAFRKVSTKELIDRFLLAQKVTS